MSTRGCRTLDTKREDHRYALGLESVSTTLQLVQTERMNIGLIYTCQFDGVVERRVEGGPIDVTASGERRVHETPEVTVTIVDYQRTDLRVSLRVVIRIAIPVIGTKTIFDQRFEGCLSTNGHSDARGH